jgi:GDP/UDP-N,N'-diacetylbacillosamine 2-epimerase (hydrolysing)
MKIGILTSSRADYGIYRPLLRKLKVDSRFKIEIIAFGMHLQSSQGNTLEEIKKDDYEVIHQVSEIADDDYVVDIARGYGKLIVDFADFWNQNSFDLIFALGDRWEMSAAVQASIPFELKIAHLHGGETTLGATDNIYRHQISLASTYHFTAAEEFSERVRSIIGLDKRVYTVGSLSLEDLDKLELPDWTFVKEQYDIPFNDFILVTFHPESVDAVKNDHYAKLAFEVLEVLSEENNVLITKANSDVMGSLFNRQFERLQDLHPTKIKLVAALGKLNYFKAMQQCAFMLGNTSSGIIEATSFSKRVINVGNRQKGRMRNLNVLDVPFESSLILKKVDELKHLSKFHGENKYFQPSPSNIILEIISQDA